MHNNPPVSAFLNKSLENRINDIKELVDSTMLQVHAEYSLSNDSFSNDDFQDEVIQRIKRPLTDKNFQMQLFEATGVWTRAKEGVLSSYFLSRTEGCDVNRYLKVAVKCNSEGRQDEVLERDIEPWLDYISLHTNKTNTRHLTKPATKKQALINLKKMLDFPVLVKETPVNTHLTETMMEGLVLNDPEKYLPAPTIDVVEKKLKEGYLLSDILIVAANVIECADDNKSHRIEGRIKSSEALKWAKYITGIRTEPLYDGLGMMEICEKIEDLPRVSKEVIELKHKGNHSLDYRLPVTLANEEQPTKKELKASRGKIEQGVMNLIKHSYLGKDDELEPARVKEARKKIVYGAWIDMKLKDKKAPIEVQVKDSLGHALYGFNSPFGHNSKAYNAVRCKELHKPVRVKDTEYEMDKVTKFVEERVLLPAFRQKIDY